MEEGSQGADFTINCGENSTVSGRKLSIQRDEVTVFKALPKSSENSSLEGSQGVSMNCEESRTVSVRKLNSHPVLFQINSSSKTDSLPSSKLEGDTLLGNQIIDMNILINVLLLLLCPL